MKARTKIQKEVVSLSKRFRPISSLDVSKIKNECFTFFGYDSGRVTTCMECGNSFFSSTNDNKSVVCPHCRRVIEVVKTKRRKYDEYAYYSVFTCVRGFQVERGFFIEKHAAKCKEPVFVINEVYEMFLNEKCKNVFLSRDASKCFCNEKWLYETPFSVKKNNAICLEGSPQSFRIARILPVLKRNGFSNDFRKCNPMSLFMKLLRSSRFETLWKLGYGEELFGSSFEKYFKQIMYCRKVGYEIKDYSVWFDMIELMKQIDAPTHCGMHLCPADLNKAHDYWSRKVFEKREKERIEQKRKQMYEDNKKYLSTHKKFIGIMFSFKGLDYHVLKNVEEFVDEGSAMHHCVYNMSYYSKKDTIIIGVRVSDERLATIELNSKKWDIVQCRGVCNKVPDRYDEILEGLNLNLHIFKRAKSSRVKIVSNS